MPRIGAQRELKKACEAFWAGKIGKEELLETGKAIRKDNWERQKAAGIDLIPSNDFSLYDQVLDMSLTLGAIPARYDGLKDDPLKLYFAMARGYQEGGEDVIAMEMTKWFDTNYHYIVPEFTKDMSFSLFSHKAVDEFKEALALGIKTKPVIIGPISYLRLGKAKEEGFCKRELMAALLPVYVELLQELEAAGAEYVQIDEPYLALDLCDHLKVLTEAVYDVLKEATGLKLIVTTYFDGLKDNAELAANLPVYGLHIDLVRASEQLDEVLNLFPKGKEPYQGKVSPLLLDVLDNLPKDKVLSLGVVDGRNIWKNDYEASLAAISKAVEKLGEERVLIAGSSSFLHVPFDLENETNEKVLTPELKRWMAFARQKIKELATLKDLAGDNPSAASIAEYADNKKAIADKKTSPLIHNKAVEARVAGVTEADAHRKSAYPVRAAEQKEILGLPMFPTTTIGSFPQTKEVRSWRAKFKKGEISAEEYDRLLKEETERCIRWQEKIGLDVPVHGEYERNDMVEYFGEQLAGFTFTQNGWVQSYGSRGVKPPVIYGDVSRPTPMTVYWSVYAQSLTDKPMKGMLTGPVTILEWSFVRNDQPREATCKQIALAIRDEVCDLEKAGIKVIQIDEPAIREGLPLRHGGWDEYLKWAVESFRVATSGVTDQTQIHTHMCYSEFNDIIAAIADMDADVITIECSRSQMELLDIFGEFQYPNEIGPGVYDIHSPRVPSVEEMTELLHKAEKVIPAQRLWVNPDCGLKTRGWDETDKALVNMVEAAKELRKEHGCL